MSMLPRTACGLLEVGHSATDQEIHAAYKKLAIRFHPDKNPNISQEATEAFQLVNEAKDTLLEASRPFYQLTESPFPEERGAALKDQYERRRRLFRRRMQYGAGAGFLAHNFEGGVGSELFEKKFGSPEDGGVVSTHASPSRRGSARHAPKHGLSGEDLDDPVSPENTPTRSTSPSPRGHACVTTPRAQVFVRPGLAGEAAATSLRMGTFFGNQGHWTCRQCGEACMIVRDAAVCERCGKTLRQHTGPGHSLSGSGGYCPGFRLKVKVVSCLLQLSFCHLRGVVCLALNARAEKKTCLCFDLSVAKCFVGRIHREVFSQPRRRPAPAVARAVRMNACSRAGAAPEVRQRMGRERRLEKGSRRVR